jgi:hypothetical protein
MRMAPALVLLLLAAALPGCAFTTGHVALRYEPSPERKSPLSTIPPRTVAVTVEDRRPAAERDRVGDKRNNLGMVTAPVLSTSDVGGVVRDALKVELRNNGHAVVEPGRPASVSVLAVLKRYWGETSLTFSQVTVVGTVAVDIAIDGGSGGGSAARSLLVTHEEGFKIMTEGRFERALNNALAEFIRIFARDPAVLDALERSRGAP